MNSKVIKHILIILALVSILFQPVVNAARPNEDDTIIEGIFGVINQGFGYFMQDDTHMDIDIGMSAGHAAYTSEMTGKIVGMVQVIGSVISILALVIIGFRYMFSSIEEKSKLHEMLKYYIIGAVLVFATSNVLSVAYNLIKQLN